MTVGVSVQDSNISSREDNYLRHYGVLNFWHIPLIFLFIYGVGDWSCCKIWYNFRVPYNLTENFINGLWPTGVAYILLIFLSVFKKYNTRPIQVITVMLVYSFLILPCCADLLCGRNSFHHHAIQTGAMAATNWGVLWLLTLYFENNFSSKK